MARTRPPGKSSPMLLVGSFTVRVAPYVALSLRFCQNGAFSLRRCMLMMSVRCGQLSLAVHASGGAESMAASSLPTTSFTKGIFGMGDRFGGLRAVRGNAHGALPTLMMTLQRGSFLHSPRIMMTLQRMSSNKYCWLILSSNKAFIYEDVSPCSQCAPVAPIGLVA